MPNRVSERSRVFAEIAGWYGIAAILLAYGLVSLGILDAKDVIYQLLNLTGAIGVVVVSLFKKLTQTVVLNVVWIAIALVGLLRSILV